MGFYSMKNISNFWSEKEVLVCQCACFKLRSFEVSTVKQQTISVVYIPPFLFLLSTEWNSASYGMHDKSTSLQCTRVILKLNVPNILVITLNDT